MRWLTSRRIKLLSVLVIHWKTNVVVPQHLLEGWMSAMKSVLTHTRKAVSLVDGTELVWWWRRNSAKKCIVLTLLDRHWKLTSSEPYWKLLVGTYYLCGNISLGCTSSSVTVSRIPNRGRTAIFVAASGEQCLERCQEHVVLHRVRIGEVADSIHRILLICANEAASLNKLRQLSSSIIYTSLFGIFTPHNLIANDALRDVAPRLWECVFLLPKCRTLPRYMHHCSFTAPVFKIQTLSGTMCRSLIPTFTQTGR